MFYKKNKGCNNKLLKFKDELHKSEKRKESTWLSSQYPLKNKLFKS